MEPSSRCDLGDWTIGRLDKSMIDDLHSYIGSFDGIWRTDLYRPGLNQRFEQLYIYVGRNANLYIYDVYGFSLNDFKVTCNDGGNGMKMRTFSIKSPEEMERDNSK